MRYYTLPAPAPLADYVRFFWVLEGTASKDQPYVHRSMADGSAELLFHYTGPFQELVQHQTPLAQPYSLVHAQSGQHRRFETFQPFGIFGAYLYPFAVPQLFNLPAHELSNHLLDLHTLLGAPGKQLEEQMMLAPDNAHRLRLLSTFLEKQLKNRPSSSSKLQATVHQVLHSKGMVSIERLAADSNLSVRQFERKFKEVAGFAPKKYARIIRFQEVLKRYQQPFQSLTELAYEFGYYDQSHFIHEFKEFSGYHPKQFFFGSAEGTDYR